MLAYTGIALKRTSTPTAQPYFGHARALGCEGIVSNRLGSPYRSGRVDHWPKVKNPRSPAVYRTSTKDWGGKR
jgi:ATP-dependent DNA ligase